MPGPAGRAARRQAAEVREADPDLRHAHERSQATITSGRARASAAFVVLEPLARSPMDQQISPFVPAPARRWERALLAAVVLFGCSARQSRDAPVTVAHP